jgi:fido (protein-threonine AMPylation protein)
VTGERDLSTGYIKELHAALLRYTDFVVVFDASGQPFETKLEKGMYKTMPNNPLRADGTFHEYCPPEHVASEMDRLIQLYHLHSERNIHPHIEAAWLHHAFAQIHPFQDGNGRVARAIASLVFIKGGFFPLVINRDDRTKYIDALEAADDGDLSPLTRLFSQVEKRALTKAIGLAVDARPIHTVEEALVATRDLLVDVGRIIPKEFLAAKHYANILGNSAISKFQEVSQRLGADISSVDPSFRFTAGQLGGQESSDPIRRVSEQLRYDPNLATFSKTVVLDLVSSNATSRIAVSFHGVGAAFRGLLVAAAYFQIGDGAAVPISEDVFRISYRETQDEIVPRFSKWLEPCIVEGIARWRRTLV